MNKNMDELCINTIRTLAMDAVQQANSRREFFSLDPPR